MQGKQKTLQRNIVDKEMDCLFILISIHEICIPNDNFSDDFYALED